MLHPVTTPTPAELALDFNNLDLKQKFSRTKAAVHAITMIDFAFEKFAAENPAVSFVHSCLGLVQTGFFKELTFVLKATAQLAFMLISPWALSIEESGKRTFVRGD